MKVCGLLNTTSHKNLEIETKPEDFRKNRAEANSQLKIAAAS